jgi:predicted transcriptional regulator
MSQILDVSVSGTTKTRIMYQAYLPYSRLTNYLNLLVAIGYLEFDDERKLFKTTAKGLDFLKSNNEPGNLAYSLSEVKN